MNLVFLGPPGVGKGTMAIRLSSHMQIPHISTGVIIRTAIMNRTELGNRVKAIVDSGALVSDDLTIDLVRERLMQTDAQQGFILDGFPRTIPQANALKEIAVIDQVINFTLDNEEIVKRLSGRRIHKMSGRTYHILFDPPKIEGKDDETGDDLIIRPDDQEETVRQRLKVYNEQTRPLIKYYKKENVLLSVDSKSRPDAVFSSLLKILY